MAASVCMKTKEGVNAMRKAVLLLLACLILCGFTLGCTDAAKGRFGTYGKEFKVTVYSHDGSMIQQWTSTGKVGWRRSGFYFLDKESGKFIMVTGTVVVESVNTP